MIFLKEFAADIKKYTKEHEHDDEIEEDEKISSPSKFHLDDDDEVVVMEEDATESESKEDHELLKEGLVFSSFSFTMCLPFPEGSARILPALTN